MNQLVAAVGAVYSGHCDVVLGYHALFRGPMFSRSAAQRPLPAPQRVRRRVRATPPRDHRRRGRLHRVGVAVPARVRRADGRRFGYVAINDRSNAMRNPAAAMRDPLTMDDYLAARMIRWPLCLLDMDVPVDGADAFVITTAERARDLPHRPVLVHAATLGHDRQERRGPDSEPAPARPAGRRASRSRRRATSGSTTVDVYFPYDGFTVITLNWIENAGFCGPGEAGAFIAEHWDDATQPHPHRRPHPGEPARRRAVRRAATQGSGHLREAVHQLQGRAGDRQVAGAERAIVTAGGFFFNAQGCTLRVD